MGIKKLILVYLINVRLEISLGEIDILCLYVLCVSVKSAVNYLFLLQNWKDK